MIIKSGIRDRGCENMLKNFPIYDMRKKVTKVVVMNEIIAGDL